MSTIKNKKAWHMWHKTEVWSIMQTQQNSRLRPESRQRWTSKRVWFAILVVESDTMGQSFKLSANILHLPSYFLSLPTWPTTNGLSHSPRPGINRLHLEFIIRPNWKRKMNENYPKTTAKTYIARFAPFSSMVASVGYIWKISELRTGMI